MTALAHKVALAVVEASKVFKADPTKFYLIGNRNVRLVAATSLFRAGAVKSAADAVKLCQIRAPNDISPSSLKKVHITPEMIEPVVAALGGPKAPEPRAPKAEKVVGPKGFARIADPEERRALAAKGGAAVPADKRAFSVNPSLASEAGSKGALTRYAVAEEPRERPRPKPLKPIAIDVASRRLAAMRAEAGFSMHRTEQDRVVPSKIMTASLMGDPKPGRTEWAIDPEVERAAMLERRLKQAHGPERARAIIAGLDAATEADVAQWRGVGA